MNHIKKEILEFIKISFSLYNISIPLAICFYEESFNVSYAGDDYYTYEDDEYWMVDNYPAIIEVASLTFGVSADDIISCNEKAVNRFDKDSYTYFFDAPDVISERIRGAFFNGSLGNLIGILSSEMSLNESIQMGKYWGVTSRYNYNTLPQRLFSRLEEEDRIFPGIYHKGEALRNLSIDTQHFISYPFLDKYISGFIEIVKRIEFLFHKILDQTISLEEIKEYDFLVLVLDARLVCDTDLNAFFKDVIYYKEYLIKHQFNEITSYLRFDFWKSPNFQPWRCIEFTQLIDLAQEFLNLIPEAKPSMRHFAMSVKYFVCEYSWSDSSIPVFSDEKERCLEYECEMLGEEYVPTEKGSPVRETFYLEKTTEEIGDDFKYAYALMKMAAPAKLGGIKVKKPEGRIILKNNALNYNCYIQSK